MFSSAAPQDRVSYQMRLYVHMATSRSGHFVEFIVALASCGSCGLFVWESYIPMDTDADRAALPAAARSHLGRVGVGKGLNIKGKSAQKNQLSGFVPYLQINDNDHKARRPTRACVAAARHALHHATTFSTRRPHHTR